MLLLYILWDDRSIFMISGSNEQQQQQLECTLLKPDWHSWWISKLQSGREGTLEERYAITCCFKLWKNATETYEMRQTACGASCMSRASVLSGIRDSRKAGCLWGMMRFVGGVRKSEHQNWLAEHTIIHEELKMRKICANFVPRVLGESQKERHCHDSRENVKLINSDPAIIDALVTIDESCIYCYDPEAKWQSSQWKHVGFLRPKKERQSKSTHKFLMIPFLTALAWSTCTGFLLDRESTRNTMLRFLREFRKRYRPKRPALFKSGQWYFQQDNAPVHNSILVTDYLTKMGIKTVPHSPYSPDLAPCDFWLFHKLKEKT